MSEIIITIQDFKGKLERNLIYFSDWKNIRHYEIAKRVKRVRTFKSLNKIVRDELLEDFFDYDRKDIKLAKQQVIDYIESNWFEKDKELANRRSEMTKKAIAIVDKFISIAENEGLEVSKSPFSNSFYLHKTGEEITWGSKPENSYRLSDHWNFYSREAYHCCSNEINDDEFAIGIYHHGNYEKVA